MTDTLETPLSTSTPLNDDTASPTVDNKRNATEDIGEDMQTKIRRTSTTTDDLGSTNAPTTNDVDDKKDDATSAPTINQTTNIPQDTLLRSNPGAAAAVFSSFLADPQQQQHFLQTYAQASGQDLTQLTASSLAQAMVSPISVPGFNLLQQLQAGNIITALPGPPGGLGLNQQQPPPPPPPPSQPHNISIKTEENTNETGDIGKSSSAHVNGIKTENNDNDTTGTSIPPSLSVVPSASSPDAAAAAAAAAAAVAARNMSNDERRQRRLLRNRVAAKECRKKKKQYIQDMEDKITRLEEENASLQRQLEDAKNKLAFSTMQGPESYRLMKEVEELNAKLGMGQQLSTTAATPTMDSSATVDTTEPSSTTDASSASGLDAVISVIASIQQRHEQQQQQQQQQIAPITSPTSPVSTSLTHIPPTIPTNKDSTSTAAPSSPSISSSADISTVSSTLTPAPTNDSSSPVPTSTSSDSSNKLVDQVKNEVKVE